MSKGNNCCARHESSNVFDLEAPTMARSSHSSYSSLSIDIFTCAICIREPKRHRMKSIDGNQPKLHTIQQASQPTSSVRNIPGCAEIQNNVFAFQCRYKGRRRLCFPPSAAENCVPQGAFEINPYLVCHACTNPVMILLGLPGHPLKRQQRTRMAFAQVNTL